MTHNAKFLEDENGVRFPLNGEEGSQTASVGEGEETSLTGSQSASNHQLNTEISNPNPAKNMGVVLPGRVTCPNLIKLVSSFTCPGATSSQIIEALKELAICNVATFNSVFQQTDITEVRELFNTAFNKLRRDESYGPDQIWSQILVLKRIFLTPIIERISTDSEGSSTHPPTKEPYKPLLC